MDGQFYYQGLTCQQNPNFTESFSYFFKKEPDFKRILEIGTAGGGCIKAIRDTLDDLGMQSIEILSFDIARRFDTETIESPTLKIKIEDIFTPGWASLKEESNVGEFISNPGKTLVLCDGGSKIKEFNVLSPFIKEGDFIMAHDYAPDRTFFSSKMVGRYWDWCEIVDSNIQKSINDHNLQQTYFDNFIKSGWCCFKRG